MEQITAKEIALEKYPVVLKYDDMKMMEEDINAEARLYFIEGFEFASLRSVSETKEGDGYNEFELRQVIAKYKNEHKYLGTPEGLAKSIIERFPIYFSPVPVSEEDHTEVLGFKTIAESKAYDKGREDNQNVMMAFIKKWDGYINSAFGQAMHDKFKEMLPTPVSVIDFKRCGEGDNVCNCKTKEECGYKFMAENVITEGIVVPVSEEIWEQRKVQWEREIKTLFAEKKELEEKLKQLSPVSEVGQMEEKKAEK